MVKVRQLRCSLALCCAHSLSRVCFSTTLALFGCCALCAYMSVCAASWAKRSTGCRFRRFVRLVLQRNSAFFDVCSCCTLSRTHTTRTRARLHKNPEREATTAPPAETATNRRNCMSFLCFFFWSCVLFRKKSEIHKNYENWKKLNWL